MRASRARTKEIGQQFRARLAWVVDPVMAIDRRRSEFFRAPKTVVVRLADQMSTAYARRFAEVGEEGIAEDLLGCWLTDKEVADAFARTGPSIEKRRERLARRYLGTEILSLFDAAHASVKNAPLALLRAPETGLRAPAAYGKLMLSRRLRGERRARALWEAVGDICEDIYLPYLRALWVTASLIRKERPAIPPMFGALVEQLRGRLEDPWIVDAHAAQVRNSIKHCNADYLVDERLVELRNMRHGVDTWCARLSVPELEVLAFDLLAAATTLNEGVALFNKAAMYNAGIFRLYMDLRLASKAHDAKHVAHLGREMEDRMRDLFTEIHALRAFGMV